MTTSGKKIPTERWFDAIILLGFIGMSVWLAHTVYESRQPEAVHYAKSAP